MRRLCLDFNSNKVIQRGRLLPLSAGVKSFQAVISGDGPDANYGYLLSVNSGHGAGNNNICKNRNAQAYLSAPQYLI